MAEMEMEDQEKREDQGITQEPDAAAEGVEQQDEVSTAASEDEAKEANEKYMRLAADFQNFKRRTESERHEIAAFANERIVKELLNVMDSFERALETAKCDDENFRNGVDLIYKQLVTVLTNFGVEEIKTDAEFDPNFHHAVLTEEAEEAGKILMVMQKGYTLNGRVVRPAMVKVSV